MRRITTRLHVAVLGPATWPELARWCVATGVVWCAIVGGYTWADNAGQPWVLWALALYLAPAGIFLLGSVLAAWTQGGWRTVGWGIVVFVCVDLLVHVMHESLDVWRAHAASR